MKEPPISSEKLQKVTLIWGIYRTKKFDQVMKKIFPLENIEVMEVNKVNIEVWKKFPTVQNTMISDLKFFKT